MPRLSLVFYLVICISAHSAVAQTITPAADTVMTVKGQVLNQETGTPIPRAHITLVQRPGIGVVSNMDGFFRFNVPKSTEALKVSFIGYKPFYLALAEVKDLLNLRVELEADTVMLQTVEVSPIVPVGLVHGAIRAISQNVDTKPYKFTGFYRETIREKEAYLSMAEAVFEIVNWPGQPGDLSRQLRLLKGRKSDEVRATRLFEDFLPRGGPNMMAGNDLISSRPSFLDSAFFAFYEYELAEITNYEGRRVYIIAFDQHDDAGQRLDKGKIFLDQNTLSVIRYESSFSPKGKKHIKRLKLQGKDGGYQFSIEEAKMIINYQELAGKWYISDAQLETQFQWQQPEKGIDYLLTVNADFLVTRIQKDNVMPLQSNETWDQNKVLIKQTGPYDESFWSNFNIIQPTQSVREVAELLGEVIKND